MSLVEFRLRRRRRLFRWPARGDPLATMLSDKYSVSLTAREPAVAVLSSPGAVESVESTAGWGSLKAAELSRFLKGFRSDPGNARAEPAIRSAVHRFLLPSPASLTTFVLAREKDAEIWLTSEERALPLLINVPWELADDVPSAPGVVIGPLLGCLAGRPLARILPGTRSSLETDPTRRVTVTYCVSFPNEEGEERRYAERLAKCLDGTLRDRGGLIDVRPVTEGESLSPRFDSLRTDLEDHPPEILIVAAHGNTDDGVPSLWFQNPSGEPEWRPVAELAGILAAKKTTFLVVLVACDLTYLALHPAAQSGALEIVKAGVPAVVAMQSKVRADLAGFFLGATIDSFFQSGSVVRAVAAGRRSMAPSAEAAGQDLDWCFPALFMAENAEVHASQLQELIRGYEPALERMLRSVPRPEPYLARPALEREVSELLSLEQIGVRAVVGGPSHGSSTLVRWCLRDELEQAVRSRNMSIRPLLYLDLDSSSALAKGSRDILEILRGRTREVGIPPHLMSWPAPRGAEGSLSAGGEIADLCGLIDRNRMILVLDNIPVEASSPWLELIEQARNLAGSLVLVVSSEPARLDHLAPGGGVEVPPWAMEEIEEYARRFGPGPTVAPEWQKWSGGIPGLLNALRIYSRRGNGGLPSGSPDQSSYGIAAAYLEAAESRLSTAGRSLLYRLANLPNGWSRALASYVAELVSLPELEELGLAIRDFRFEAACEWLRLPGALIEVLWREREEEVGDAADSLTEHFRRRVLSAGVGGVENHIKALAEEPGGLGLLHDIQGVLLMVGSDAMAGALPLLLDRWLYSRGRWFDALGLWERYLSQVPEDSTQAHEWLKLGKACHILGRARRAWECIEKASGRGASRLDKVDILDLEAALLKDRGNHGQLSCILQCYDKALEITNSELARDPSTGFTEADRRAFEESRAKVRYNRALIRRHWQNDLKGALEDLKYAADSYEQLGNSQMKFLAHVSWVDVQLDAPTPDRDWSEMLKRLVEADQYFKSTGNAGDRAFCAYQRARLLRRRPFFDDNERRRNLKMAKEAYGLSAQAALEAQDLRQRAIAQGHVVEVDWSELGTLGDNDAASILDGVVADLEFFSRDAWSARVLRDMLLLRAGVARRLAPAECRGWLERSLAVAGAPPLHPERGVDALRAAKVMYELLQELRACSDWLEVENVTTAHKSQIEGWLRRCIEPSRPDEWSDELEKYITKSGEPHG